MNQPNHDSPETIIEAVRDCKEAFERYTNVVEQGLFEVAETSRAELHAATVRLRALRLPLKGEGR